MIPDRTLKLLERIARESGMTRQEIVEEFNETTQKISSESVDRLEKQLRIFFGLLPSDHVPRTPTLGKALFDNTTPNTRRKVC
jgi:hypothetical protein